MYTFINFFSQSFYQTNSTPTPPPSPTTASTLQHECKICKTSFKSTSGLTRHNTIVQKYNMRRKGLYELPLEAIKEFKAQLVHIIQGKLKGHFLSRVNKLFLYLVWKAYFLESLKVIFIIIVFGMVVINVISKIQTHIHK